ncbi:hypothetical protein EA462_09070 [Natrarchaeobius halalkaliphilus]|uniref:Uncharacterized protein n=1 Tax=Natrarchaeobius halalkaliphilus TaxID=1679091 RepID=A0A3N6M4H0_9EURY|nr:hypothetical protein [Natrarchaeobius halalkaliphilus]RQG90131.1 hypothetical protein EA462_09070 [Natrarchaeobius halalkaliphilus]
MATSSQTADEIEIEVARPTEEQSFKERIADVATVGGISGAGDAAIAANEHAEEVADQHFDNVLINGIMTVLIGGILLTLAGVIITDFVEIMPEEGFMDQGDITSPLSTALGLTAISLVVPVVAGVVALLMGSFGGFMGTAVESALENANAASVIFYEAHGNAGIADTRCCPGSNHNHRTVRVLRR